MTSIFTKFSSSHYFSHTLQLIVPAMPCQIKGEITILCHIIPDHGKQKGEARIAYNKYYLKYQETTPP